MRVALQSLPTDTGLCEFAPSKRKRGVAVTMFEDLGLTEFAHRDVEREEGCVSMIDI